MGKLKRHPVGRQLVETLELPRDLFFGSVILTVTGQEEIIVENYKGILEYTRESIRLQTKTCRLFLSGKNLKIVYYTNDEMKSSAYTFLFVGVLGILAMILIALDIIPLHMAAYMRVIMAIVMGGLFLFFLFIGVQSFRKMKGLSSEADSEETLTNEILTSFLNGHTAASIDASISDAGTMENEQLYFYRYEQIKRILSEDHPGLAEDYTEDLIEKIYTSLFPDMI